MWSRPGPGRPRCAQVRSGRTRRTGRRPRASRSSLQWMTRRRRDLLAATEACCVCFQPLCGEHRRNALPPSTPPSDPCRRGQVRHARSPSHLVPRAQRNPSPQSDAVGPRTRARARESSRSHGVGSEREPSKVSGATAEASQERTFCAGGLSHACAAMRDGLHGTSRLAPALWWLPGRRRRASLTCWSVPILSHGYTMRQAGPPLRNIATGHQACTEIPCRPASTR